MSIKKYVDEAMKNVQVDENIKMEILNSTVRAQTTKGGRSMRKRILVGALIATMCLGTVAVTADSIATLWNKTIAGRYGIDQDIQKKSVEEGIVQVFNGNNEVSDTNNGIKVTIEQVVATPYTINMYVGVESTNGLKIDSKSIDFAEVKLTYGDVSMGISGSAWELAQKPYLESESHNGYWLSFHSHEGEFTGVLDAVVTFKDLIIFNNEDVSGEWSLPIEIDIYDESRHIELGHTWEREATLENSKELESTTFVSMDIYPTTICIRYTGEQMHDINLFPCSITMKDGTKHYYNAHFDENINFIRAMDMDGLEIRDFINVIDIENIDYVEVAGEKYDVN